MGTLAEDARALISATADVAGDKVGAARQRLADALENVKETAGRVRDKTVAGAPDLIAKAAFTSFFRVSSLCVSV